MGRDPALVGRESNRHGLCTRTFPPAFLRFAFLTLDLILVLSLPFVYTGQLNSDKIRW